jgi:hypothetical protein
MPSLLRCSPSKKPSLSSSAQQQDPAEPCGLDLCLWVSHDRLRRTEINRNPSVVPADPRDMTQRQRARLVQDALQLLELAAKRGILSYHKLFMVHDQDELKKVCLYSITLTATVYNVSMQ